MTPSDDAQYYYFTIGAFTSLVLEIIHNKSISRNFSDDNLVYMSFFEDWGPLNIAMVYKACILIHELLEVCLLTLPFFL